MEFAHDVLPQSALKEESMTILNTLPVVTPQRNLRTKMKERFINPSRNRTISNLSSFAILLLASTPLFAQPVGLIQRTEFLPDVAEETTGPEIATGPDGALWITDSAGNIDRLTTSGSLTVYPIPTADGEPQGITKGPDGALWFTEYSGNKIGRITTAGVITEFPLPEPDSRPTGITAGPDGALWFTESTDGASKIGRISTSGAITEFPVLATSEGQSANGICTGPDGALWFTEYYGWGIGRITTSGEETVYDVGFATYPLGITSGPDGALWFTNLNNDTIGRITTAGVVTAFPVGGEGYPEEISRGPNGDLWFTLSDAVGSITTSGVVTIYPAEGTYSYGITAGPGGTAWYVGTNVVGEVVSTNAELSTSVTTGGHGTPITLTGSGYNPGEKVKLYADNAEVTYIASVTADNSGGFTFVEQIQAAPYGYHAFIGTGQASGKTGIAAFNETPQVDLSPVTGLPGSAATVSGFGYPPEEAVTIKWGAAPGLTLGSATTDLNGSFVVEVTIPPSATPGTYFITGETAGFTLHAKAQFLVQ